jgi:hypothetical protein
MAFAFLAWLAHFTSIETGEWCCNIWMCGEVSATISCVVLVVSLMDNYEE